MTKMIRFFSLNLVLGNEPHVMCNLGNDRGVYPEVELISLLKQGLFIFAPASFVGGPTSPCLQSLNH